VTEHSRPAVCYSYCTAIFHCTILQVHPFNTSIPLPVYESTSLPVYQYQLNIPDRLCATPTALPSFTAAYYNKYIHSTNQYHDQSTSLPQLVTVEADFDRPNVLPFVIKQIHRVSKKTVLTYFLSELGQISTDCKNFWHKDSRENRLF